MGHLGPELAGYVGKPTSELVRSPDSRTKMGPSSSCRHCLTKSPKVTYFERSPPGHFILAELEVRRYPLRSRAGEEEEGGGGGGGGEFLLYKI